MKNRINKIKSWAKDHKEQLKCIGYAAASVGLTLAFIHLNECTGKGRDGGIWVSVEDDSDSIDIFSTINHRFIGSTNTRVSVNPEDARAIAEDFVRAAEIIEER